MEDKSLQIRKHSVKDKNSHEGSEMNFSRAFKILECNTLAKKWNWKSQSRKLLNQNHPDKNPSAKTEEFIKINSARHFLVSYPEELRQLSYGTIKILFIWTLFVFLKNFLSRKREKINSKNPHSEVLEKTPARSKGVLDLVTGSFTFFASEFFLLWWILSSQKSLAKER